MHTLIPKLMKANEAYRNGKPLLMTDEEYDAGLEALAKLDPTHTLLKTTRGPIVNTEGTVVRMPYYLGSLDKAKTVEELAKWTKKSADKSYIVSEKLDGISGLFNPGLRKLYLSGDDNMGLDVSAWIPISLKVLGYLIAILPIIIGFAGNSLCPSHLCLRAA
jgi:DNA ligase (NAD+)